MVQTHPHPVYIKKLRREFYKKNIKEKKKINENIRASKIRLIGEQGEQLGIVDFIVGLQKARKKNLDLVEINSDENLCVCKIMDYGKFRYKKKKQKKKKLETSALKEIKFRPKIDTHDYDFKIKQGKKFLENGNKVKISLIFRGRELQFRENGLKIFHKVLGDLSEYGATTDQVKITGRINSVTLNSLPSNHKKKNEIKNKNKESSL